MDWGWVSVALSLLAAIATFAVGLVVWFAERKNPFRIPFLYLTIFVASWIATNVIFAVGPVDAQFGMALLSYAAAQLVAVQTLFFAWRVTKRRLGLKSKTILLLGYVFAVLSALPGFVGVSVVDGSIVTNNLGILLYALSVAAYLLSASIYLVNVQRTASKVLKRKIRLILAGVVISSLIGTMFNLVFPILGNYSFILLGPAGAFVFILAIAYAIARYKLFDVRLAIVRGIAYLATFTTLAITYVVIVLLIANLLNRTIASPLITGFNAALVLLMAALLPSIKRFFDRVTGKVFYRDSYTSDQFYEIFNQSISSSKDLRGMLNRVSITLATTLKAEQVMFFVLTSRGRHTTIGTEGHVALAPGDMAALKDYVASLRSSKSVFHVSELEEGHGIRRLLHSYKVELVVPLVRDSQITGFLLLGERRTGEYSRRDVRLLNTIIDGLLIAIENALAVQEVKDLNANLEQRIEAATKELRASNAQLQRLDEAKDEFISMASHQLRTPLTSIKGYVSMLMEGDVGKVTDEQKHLLQEAFVSSERMVRLIGDFLNVSRLQTGKFVIDKHPVDLAQLVADEIDALGSNASSRNLSFSYKKPKGIPQLLLDENKIQQVIMNFADNAIYYSKEESTIQVTLKKVDGMVEFTVKDSGIGVPEAQQDQLFNKFFRATNARQQRPDGTGVGLFLAKKVIDAHDGEIVFSSKENKGSTFGFRLPIDKLRASGDADKLGN